jgi:Abscisic acid G-protein coupled receptor
VWFILFEEAAITKVSQIITILISELNTLQAEIKGLSQMISSLQSQHSSLHTLHHRQIQRNTPRGILSLLTRHSFALYCLYRILATGWSNFRLLLGNSTTTETTAGEDPVSRILALLTKAWISTTNVPFDIEAYGRLIGFILVGVVIAGSINAVMSTIQRLSRSTPLAPATYTLSMSWLSGTYFVSTAVMLRSNLPETYVGGIGNAFGSSLQRGIFEEWFDLTFFVVAVVTGVGLLVVRSWSDELDIELEGKEV